MNPQKTALGGVQRSDGTRTVLPTLHHENKPESQLRYKQSKHPFQATCKPLGEVSTGKKREPEKKGSAEDSSMDHMRTGEGKNPGVRRKHVNPLSFFRCTQTENLWGEGKEEQGYLTGGKLINRRGNGLSETDRKVFLVEGTALLKKILEREGSRTKFSGH